MPLVKNLNLGEFLELWHKSSTLPANEYTPVSDIQGLIDLMTNPKRSYWTISERVNFGFGTIEFPPDPIRDTPIMYSVIPAASYAVLIERWNNIVKDYNEGMSLSNIKNKYKVV